MLKYSAFHIILIVLLALIMFMAIEPWARSSSPLEFTYSSGANTPNSKSKRPVVVFEDKDYQNLISKAQLASTVKKKRECLEKETRHELIMELRDNFEEMNQFLLDLAPEKVMPYPNDLSSSTDELDTLMDKNAKLFNILSTVADDEISRSPSLYEDSLLVGEKTPSSGETPLDGKTPLPEEKKTLPSGDETQLSSQSGSRKNSASSPEFVVQPVVQQVIEAQPVVQPVIQQPVIPIIQPIGVPEPQPILRKIKLYENYPVYEDMKNVHRTREHKHWMKIYPGEESLYFRLNMVYNTSVVKAKEMGSLQYDKDYSKWTVSALENLRLSHCVYPDSDDD